MKPKLILIGPKSGKKGGATVAFGYLLNELDRRSISYTLIDTGTERKGVKKLLGFLKHLTAFNREIVRGSTISLHASNTRALIYTIILYWFAKRRESKLFIRLFGGNYPEFLASKPEWVQTLALNCYREYTLMLETKGMIEDYKERVGEGNLVWFPNSRSVNKNPVPERLLTDDNQLRMIFAGHICRQKGIDLLLDLGRKANRVGLKIKIDLYGEVIEEAYKEKVQNYPYDNLEYNGVVEPEQLMAEMRRSDLMVFPSLEGEGYPGVIIEAINMNLPVIASQLKYNHELINDGVDGILFDETRPEMLWFKIQELCNNPQKLKKIKQELQEKETKFSSEYWNGEYFLDLIQK